MRQGLSVIKDQETRDQVQKTAEANKSAGEAIQRAQELENEGKRIETEAKKEIADGVARYKLAPTKPNF